MTVVVHFRHGEDVSRSEVMALTNAIELLDRYHNRYPFEVFYLSSTEYRQVQSLPVKLGDSLNT